jgi:G3E family GTPase
VTPDHVLRVRDLLRRVNAAADIECTAFSRVADVRSLLRIEGLGVDHAAGQVSAAPSSTALCHTCAGGHDACPSHGPVPDAHPHRHTEAVGTQYVECRGTFADMESVDRLLTDLLCGPRAPAGFGVLRLKALLHVNGVQGAIVVQAVRDMWDTQTIALPDEADPDLNKVVFIGRNLHLRDLERTITLRCLPGP